MKSRLLIAYATRAGSTGEVAQAIADILRKRGFWVDLRPIKTRPNPAHYQGVILGSAVRRGRWLPEAVAFAAQHQLSLKRLPVALLPVHLLNTGSDPQSVARRRAYAAPVRQMLRPVSEAYFSGALNPAHLALPDRLRAKWVKPPLGDWRDWDRIRGWARNVLAERLTGEV